MKADYTVKVGLRDLLGLHTDCANLHGLFQKAFSCILPDAANLHWLQLVVLNALWQVLMTIRNFLGFAWISGLTVLQFFESSSQFNHTSFSMIRVTSTHGGAFNNAMLFEVRSQQVDKYDHRFPGIRSTCQFFKQGVKYTTTCI